MLNGLGVRWLPKIPRIFEEIPFFPIRAVPGSVQRFQTRMNLGGLGVGVRRAAPRVGLALRGVPRLAQLALSAGEGEALGAVGLLLGVDLAKPK